MVYTLKAVWAPASSALAVERGGSDEDSVESEKSDEDEDEDSDNDQASSSNDDSDENEDSEKSTREGGKYGKRPDDKHDEDIQELAKIIRHTINRLSENFKSVHIILRQGVKNAEGPDLMVITVKAKEAATTREAAVDTAVGPKGQQDQQPGMDTTANMNLELLLDLYQCKNFRNFKGNFVEGWFHTVGVKKQGEQMVLCNDEDKKAGYCNNFVFHLMEGVGQNLGMDVLDSM